MTNEFTAFCETLTKEIKEAYEVGVSLEHAEKLAAKFLHAQLIVGEQLRTVDLDARMKKSGVKAIKAAVYLEAATKTEKKPSDVMLDAIVNTNELVMGEQKLLDTAEVNKAALENHLNVFRESHIFFRGVAKAKFE